MTLRLGWMVIKRGQRFLVDCFLHAVGVVDHRVYMRLFNRVMAHRGMQISGTPRYVSPRAVIDGTDPSLLSLSDGCVISSGVRILTHDFSIDRMARETDDDGAEHVLIAPVHVGKRCFVGAGSILLPGAHLEDGVVVGAGSVVRGRIGQNSVVIGNPAQVVSDTKAFAEKNFGRSLKRE